MKLEAEAENNLEIIIDDLLAGKDKNFGNAREIRNLTESLISIQNTRIASLANISRDEILHLRDKDLQTYMELNAIGIFNRQSIEFESNQLSLDSLIGIQSVKTELKKLVAVAKLNKLRQEQSMKVSAAPLHMVFKGNPGTGKTTVARFMVQELYKADAIRECKFQEVAKADLIGRNAGDTCQKTLSYLEKARGGILFIDEAYTLDDGEKGLGREVIDTLMKYMEDHSKDLVVIVAGYEQEMDQFLGSNPGLASRFTKSFMFEDYSPYELTQIFISFAKKSDYHVSKLLMKKLIEILTKSLSNKSSRFGNGRAMRNLFNLACESHALRLSQLETVSNAQLQTLDPDDLTESMVASIL